MYKRPGWDEYFPQRIPELLKILNTQHQIRSDAIVARRGDLAPTIGELSVIRQVHRNIAKIIQQYAQLQAEKQEWFDIAAVQVKEKHKLQDKIDKAALALEEGVNGHLWATDAAELALKILGGDNA